MVPFWATTPDLTFDQDRGSIRVRYTYSSMNICQIRPIDGERYKEIYPESGNRREQGGQDLGTKEEPEYRVF